MKFKILASALFLSAIVFVASAASSRPQLTLFPSRPIAEIIAEYGLESNDSLGWSLTDSVAYVPLIDRPDFDSIMSTPQRNYGPLPSSIYRPVVFDNYMFLDSLELSPNTPQRDFPEAFQWLDDLEASTQLAKHAKLRYLLYNIDDVKFNQALLPVPPKHYKAVIDPITTQIHLEEITVQKEDMENITAEIERVNWIENFNGSLQFSQAYISPNWYQGGNKSLNLIGQAIYNIKLNQKFYPKLLFETTVQYKVALNSAPEDSIHSVNISDDLFQINSTFGLKASNRWYYSSNLTFKTQLLKSYPTNSRDLKSSFMSPGELNVGVGMTYNYNNAPKTFSFTASISPLSWNMRTCINKNINPTNFGIKEGRKVNHEFGSNVECNMNWKIAYNIVYTSRLFVFTDYSYVQGDWENTISFDINKYLSTKLYAHLRYDSSTPRLEGTDWHRFQFKEILSFGFNYRFSTI